ncbi:hypothetical protein BDV93DRAFT_556412 [Ceratobasidium sp. AG-I]|nr:hypothetical protein BDV93DRAFT_556412 [Ceratobasidium sp. AG-I]
MSHYKAIYDRWYKQQSCPPQVQWSGKCVAYKGQQAWLVEAITSDRVIARAQYPSKDVAESECAKQLLIQFRVPHD